MSPDQPDASRIPWNYDQKTIVDQTQRGCPLVEARACENDYWIHLALGIGEPLNERDEG